VSASRKTCEPAQLLLEQPPFRRRVLGPQVAGAQPGDNRALGGAEGDSPQLEERRRHGLSLRAERPRQLAPHVRRLDLRRVRRPAADRLRYDLDPRMIRPNDVWLRHLDTSRFHLRRRRAWTNPRRC
jgi:hypothetical protein